MSRPRPSGGPLPWPTYQNGQYVPVSGRESRSEGQLNTADCGRDGPFRRIYAVGRAGSRTPDPYDKLGVQLQVRVDVRNSISPDIAFYEVRQKGGKNASGAGQKPKNFCDGPSQSGVCFG